MPKETILRDYQLEMLDRLLLAWEQHQSVMVQMPTGVGKTHLMAEVIRREKGKEKSEKNAIALNFFPLTASKGQIFVKNQ
jgi:superfamily II DNA or RNA helicase